MVLHGPAAAQKRAAVAAELFLLKALTKGSDKNSLSLSQIQDLNQIQTLYLIPIIVMHFRLRLGRVHEDAGI